MSPTAGATLAAVLLPPPAALAGQALRAAGLMLGGSLLVALSAQVTIPLWPVPITGQTFGVLVVGMALGPRLGAGALALYLAEGLAGLPVFAGGAGGPQILASPSFGYLVGFIPAAALIGWLAERGWDRSFRRTALAMLLGNAALYAPGLLWLGGVMATAEAAWAADSIARWTEALPGLLAAGPLGSEAGLALAVLMAGLVPFLVGDAAKLLLAAAAMPFAWRALRRAGGRG